MLQDVGTLDSWISETPGSNGDVGDGTTVAASWPIFGTDFGSIPQTSGGSYVSPATSPSPLDLAPAPSKTPTGSSLTNLFTNLAAGAAAIGLATLGRGAGVSNAYASSSAAALLAKPGTVSPTQAALSAQAATTPFIFMGFLVIVGLVVYSATRKKE